MKRFVSLILSVCFLFSINTVSYAANISSRKASNPVIQSMNDKYHVDFSGMSIDELNKFIDKMKDEDQTRACSISPLSTSWTHSKGLLYSSQSSSARCAGVLPYSSSMARQSMAMAEPSANCASARLVSIL